MTEKMGIQSQNRTPMEEKIHRSLVRTLLEELGYQIISISSGYDLTELRDSDVYFSSPAGDIGDFSDLPLITTPALLIKEKLLYNAHRARALFTLETLKEIPKMNGPQFEFAHLLMPHPPFIFGPNGEIKQPIWVYNCKDGNNYQGTTEQYIHG